MRPLASADIRGPKLYAGFRDDLRKRVIEHKIPRRVVIGERVSLVFEDRLTLMFQIEEILRVENITEPAKIQEEIDVYNELMPGDSSLSATLFIELPPDADPVAELQRLVGLDEHVALRIGPHTLRAAFEPGRSTAEKISAVQYVRFPLPAEARAALATPGTPVVISIDHPSYTHDVTATEETRASLANDYTGVE
jgi:hypothetical protein